MRLIVEIEISGVEEDDLGEAYDDVVEQILDSIPDSVEFTLMVENEETGEEEETEASQDVAVDAFRTVRSAPV